MAISNEGCRVNPGFGLETTPPPDGVEIVGALKENVGDGRSVLSLLQKDASAICTICLVGLTKNWIQLYMNI